MRGISFEIQCFKVPTHCCLVCHTKTIPNTQQLRCDALSCQSGEHCGRGVREAASHGSRDLLADIGRHTGLGHNSIDDVLH